MSEDWMTEEETLISWTKLLENARKERDIARAKAQRLVEALEFYADEGNYTYDEQGNHMATSWQNNMCGKKARQALKEWRGDK